MFHAIIQQGSSSKLCLLSAMISPARASQTTAERQHAEGVSEGRLTKGVEPAGEDAGRRWRLLEELTKAFVPTSATASVAVARVLLVYFKIIFLIIFFCAIWAPPMDCCTIRYDVDC